MDGEKGSERDCEGDAWVGVVRKKEKEMETGEVGFLFFVAWNGGRGRKNKDENGNVLPEWRLWAGGVYAGREALRKCLPAARCVLLLAKSGILYV